MLNKLKSVFQRINITNSKILQLEQKQDKIELLVKENYWANVFNSAVRGCSWFDGIQLNVGRWAGNYTLFYILFRILNEIKPPNVLELGLGETTKMIQAYKRLHNLEGTCISIEQNQEWIDFRLQKDISKDFIKLIHVPAINLNVYGVSTLIYEGLNRRLSALDLTFNLILVDGPWGSTSYSRYNIVELIEDDLLHDDYIIIVDDYNRNGEQQTVTEIKSKLLSKEKKFIFGEYAGEKTVAIIASEKYKYLQSL